MNRHAWIRPLHRWTSIAFVLCVVATSVALAREQPIAWIAYLPLLPLALLALTGLYLFALPYVTRRATPAS